MTSILVSPKTRPQADEVRSNERTDQRTPIGATGFRCFPQRPRGRKNGVRSGQTQKATERLPKLNTEISFYEVGGEVAHSGLRSACGRRNGYIRKPDRSTNSLEVDGEVVVGHGLLGHGQVLRDCQRLLRQGIVHVVPGGRRAARRRRRRGRRGRSSGSRASLRLLS